MQPSISKSTENFESRRTFSCSWRRISAGKAPNHPSNLSRITKSPPENLRPDLGRATVLGYNHVLFLRWAGRERDGRRENVRIEVLRGGGEISSELN